MFSSDSNAQVTLSFGKNVNDTAFLNTMSILSGTEQLQFAFTTPVPADYEAVYEGEGEQKVLVPYMTETFKVADFLGTVGNLLSMNEMLYLEKKDSGLIIVGAKDNTVKLQLEALAPEQLGMPLMIDRTKLLSQMQFEVPSFLEALRTGGCMVHSNADEAHGMGNILLAMQYESKENAKVEGLLKIYSTNGTSMSRGQCKAIFVEDSQIHANLAKFMEEKNVKGYMAGIPKKSQTKLLKLVKDASTCSMMASDKHICAAIGSDTMFTFIQGANITTMVFKADELQKQEKSGFSIVCDTEELKGKVDILKSISSYKKCICNLLLTITDKAITLEVSGKKDLGTVKVTLSKSSVEKGNKVKVYFDGDKLSSVVGALKKGNLTIGCAQEAEYIAYPVQFTNGDNANTSTEVVFVAPVNGPKTKETEAEAEGVTEE